MVKVARIRESQVYQRILNKGDACSVFCGQVRRQLLALNDLGTGELEFQVKILDNRYYTRSGQRRVLDWFFSIQDTEAVINGNGQLTEMHISQRDS